MDAPRFLTAGETDLLRVIFNARVDYRRVRLAAGASWYQLPQSIPVALGFAVAIGNSIHFPETGFRADFSTAPVTDQAWLAHEVGHVWQHQNDPAYHWLRAALERPMTGGRPCAYVLERGKPLRAYRFEQQAEILADYFRALAADAAGPLARRYEALLAEAGLGRGAGA